MVIYKKIKIGRKNFVHAYSDAGVKIERDGTLYDDAVDPASAGREYTETDIPVECEIDAEFPN